MTRTRTRALSTCAAALVVMTAAGAAPPGTLAIRNARILPMAGPEIASGTVVVEGGTIKAIGREIAVPAHATVIDAKGGWLLPGLIDAHSTVGFTDDGRATGADELSSPNTAQLQVLDGLNPFDKRLRRHVMAGITAALLTPGRANVIGGQAAVIRLAGRTVTEMALLAPAGVKFSLGEGPRDAYGEKGRLPATRMGSAFVVRKALLDAGEYQRKLKEYEAKVAKGDAAAKDGSPEPPKTDLALEPLARLLDGRLPAFIECYRSDDIMTALRLVDEFHLRAVLIGATEGFKVADEIARRKIPVIVGPMGVGPKRVETQDVAFGNAAALSKAGVTIAIEAEDAMGVGAAEELPLAAALAVKGGLSRDLALQAITATAARILGVGDRIGTLEPGKDADLVLFTGDPLHYLTRVDRVIVAGTVQ